MARLLWPDGAQINGVPLYFKVFGKGYAGKTFSQYLYLKQKKRDK